jgi:hypothetical protein
MRRLQYREILLSGLILALVVYVRNVSVIRVRAQYAAARHGRFTVEQILDQAVRLNEVLSSNGEQYTYVPEYGEVFCRDGARRGTWSVSCTNSSQTHERFFFWDADSGELVRVTRKDPPHQHAVHVLTSAEAANHAVSLVRYLGMVKPQDHCQLTAPPRRVPSGIGWCIDMKAGQKRLSAHVNRMDGGLFVAWAWYMKSPTQALSQNAPVGIAPTISE